MEFNHIPVMLTECINALSPKDNGVYFDGTLGGCGHSLEILKTSSPNGQLIATDLDTDALLNAKTRLAGYEGRFQLFHSNFKEFLSVLEKSGRQKIDGALLDLGMSSYQIDSDRGFAYIRDCKLDMRMNTESDFSAQTVVNEYSESQLVDIFYTYGEEKFSKVIAKNICETRKQKRIETTGQLVEIIKKSIPQKFKIVGGHPAKRVFQAIRIEVNAELKGLEQCLKDIVSKLNKGGRLAVITFHSLEDRIVKKVFSELETDCICDKRLPVCVCGKRREVKSLTNKPIVASSQELLVNSRAKSAKLRVVEKI